MGGAPTILFAHERPGIGRAVQRVLELNGYEVELAADGPSARQCLAARRYGALVVDVALPGIAGYELCRQAKTLGPDAGAAVVVFVASVYRRTSYKRRPSRLYGADDYVEIHHLGDKLPEKLGRLLQTDSQDGDEHEVARATEALRDEGDTRLSRAHAQRLAALIVADMVLYNGDQILGAADMDGAQAAVAEDLTIARELFSHIGVAEDEGGTDPIGEAFASLMHAMGRAGGPP